MTKADWIRKLTSRKFWAAIAAGITGLIAYIKNPGDPTSLIMSIGAMIAYIVGEGFVDAARERGAQFVVESEGEIVVDDSGEV